MGLAKFRFLNLGDLDPTDLKSYSRADVHGTNIHAKYLKYWLLNKDKTQAYMFVRLSKL